MLERLVSTVRLASVLPALARFRPGGRYTVADRLEERARSYGEATFLAFGERRVSYRETDARANRVAHWALARGIGKGDPVALLMENRPEYIFSWGGLAKLGAISALINTNLGGRALDHALQTAGARHLVVGSECLERLGSASPETLAGLEIWEYADAEATGERPRELDGSDLLDLDRDLADCPIDDPGRRLREDLRTGDDLFYIYTSGTTGNPKAARFSHLRFFQGGDGFAWMCGTSPDDVEYLVLPLYHTAGGVVAVGRALCGGASLALRRRFSASRFWDDSRRYGATCFQYIGELCRYLLAQPERADDADNPIRIAVGNGMRPDIWQAFQERFGIERVIEFYGATEANTGFVNYDGKVGAVGRMPFQQLTNARLVRFDVETQTHPRDEDGFCIECAPDEPGELLGKVPQSRLVPQGRFEGYTSREDSERKLLHDVFQKGDAWFRSGDLLYRDDEGYYYFVDRIGDTFRWKGENVSTQEVAEILAALPGLELANVYGVEVPHADGRAGMLAYVPKAGAEFDGTRFYAFVEEQLPRYAAPVFVRALTEADVTGTFKLRKVALQREGFDCERIDDPIWLRDDAAKTYLRLTPALLAEIRSGERSL